MGDGKKKKEQMQRDKRRQEGEVRKGKGQKEIERKAEQFAYKRTHARVSRGEETGGGEWHHAERRMRERLDAPAKNFHRARNSITSSRGGNKDSLTSWSLPLFLNTIIRFLFSIASAAIFSITNSRAHVNQCMPARGCSSYVIAKCISRRRVNSRSLLYASFRYDTRPATYSGLHRLNSTELHSVPTSHSMRCTQIHTSMCSIMYNARSRNHS